jgi:hypothetical protein
MEARVTRAQGAGGERFEERTKRKTGGRLSSSCPSSQELAPYYMY